MINLSKYVLNSGKYYEHNHNCSLCSVIDDEYSKINDSFNQQDKIKKLEELLVNGYNLVNVYESNNKKISNLSSYKTYNDDILKKALSKFSPSQSQQVYNTYYALDATLLFGRFCRECGARKHDIFDTHLLLNNNEFNFLYTLSNDCSSITLTWTKITYSFGYYVYIYKKSDISDFEELYKTNENSLSFTDTKLDDGRVYSYKIKYFDETGNVMFEKTLDVLVPTNKDHTPNKINNLVFMKHRELLHNEGTEEYRTHDYITAKYDVNSNDTNFGDVIFKMNEEHVPAIDYWYNDIQFMNHDEYTFTDRMKRYFLKPYIRSRVFRKDGTDDHDLFPDLYYWNSSMPATFMSFSLFEDDMYNLTFQDGFRSMKINYSLKVKNTVKYVRIVFKQDNKIILNNQEFSTYKIVDVPAIHALYDYEVNITRLASNSYWVFGVFPVYENSTEDIRLEFQKIVKINPCFDKTILYDETKFYDMGDWYKDKDFDKYNLRTYEKISYNKTPENVYMCDKLKHKDVSVLLIHEDEVSECFTVSFDYKMIAKNKDDRLNYFMNFTPELKVVDTYDQWRTFKKTYFNKDFMILRWEQMKMGEMPYTCTFVKNIKIDNETIIDTYIDNFTRTDLIKFKEFYYYNKKIRHNSKHQHVPKKFYNVDIIMNDYYDKDVKGE